MVKSYLRYELRDTFGVVASPAANTIYDASGRLAICPALESVNVWNLRQGTLVKVLRDGSVKVQVTAIERSPDARHVAVGYSDGRIAIFRMSDGVRALQLHGHRSAVTALRYSKDGSLLASGARDTDVIVWDPLGESGLYRLKGHKGDITDVAFLEGTQHLVTASKDTFVKVWDRETQHCVQTIVGHRSEVWSLDVNASETRLITGSGDHELRVFRLRTERGKAADGDKDVATPMGVIGRPTRQRVVRLRYSPSGRTVACHTADKVVQLLAVRDEEAVKRKVRKRRRREKKRAGATEVESEEDAGSLLAEATAEEELASLDPLRMSDKVRSVDFAPAGAVQGGGPSRERLLVALHTNALRVVDVDCHAKSGKAEQAGKAAVLELPGHRAGVRDVALSDDDTLAMTASSDQVKVWNVSSRACVRTLDVASGYALCCAFAPGGRHCLIGTKEGNIEIWSVSSASLLACVKAHDGPVWAMEVRPDRRGMTTGGGDKQIKFWDFELVTNEAGARSLSVVHTRTLKVTDDVLCLTHSPDGRYIAAGLLDCTVKVFYHDSLKFFLSLYGHRLPVLSVHISSDSTLLASGSADKNVKIWGLDFGDCHKSIFAHADSVMRVRWVPKTHYFFSAGKDRLLKYWDGDRFEQILQLDGHHAEVWSLAVSNAGDFCVTGGNDLSVRLWEKTQEPVFLEEERERKVAEMADQSAAAEMERREIGEMEGSGLVANTSTAVVGVGTALPGAASAEAAERQLKASERLLEALDLARSEEERYAAHANALEAFERRRALSKSSQEAALAAAAAGVDSDEDSDEDEDLGGVATAASTDVAPAPPPPNPFLRGYKPEDFVFHQLKLVPRASLEETLLVLPFEAAMRLAEFLNRFVRQGRSIELCVRALMFLVSVHQNQIVTNNAMADVLRGLRTATRKRLRHHRDEMGFNVAALHHLQRELKSASGSRFFGDLAEERAKRARQ